MYTIKVTHQPEKRDFDQFIAIIDTAMTDWKISRWERNVPHVFKLEVKNRDEMYSVLKRYDIHFTMFPVEK